MAKVVIVGTGSFGRLVRRYLEADSNHDVVSFAVHRRYKDQEACDGLPVVSLEDLERHHPSPSVQLFVGCGYTNVNRDRETLTREVRERGYTLISYVSTTAQVWPGTEIGEGSCLFEGVTVQPGVTIGSGVIVWSGSTICHDSVLEDYCFLASNVVISGNTRLGHHTFVGANATFRDGITTGPSTVVGAGAVITRDTAERSVHSVRGTPARGEDSNAIERL